MDKIDKFILEDISGDIVLPNSYTNTILEGFNKKEKIKQYRFQKVIRTLSMSVSSIILCTGIAFASYNIYEKVWKEPIEYNTIDEKIINEINNDNKSNNENFEKNEIISIEDAVDIFSNIFTKLEINQEVFKENILINKDSFSNYFEFSNEQYKMNISANGVFKYFNNESFDYTAKNDDISQSEATKLANKIMENINLNEKYTLANIEYTSSFKNGHKANVWLGKYCQTINGLKNKYDCIYLSFSIVNNMVIIEKITTSDNQFSFQNNEIIITRRRS